MTPELSRACGQIKLILNLEDGGPQMQNLLQAANTARTVDDLPRWARAVLHSAGSQR